MNILINNGIVIPMTESDFSSRKFYKASVGITGNRIVMVSERNDDISNFRISHQNDLIEIDAEDKIVMPGLINTHTHLTMALLRGYSDDVKLMDWLTKHIWPIEGKFTPNDIYLGAKLGLAEMALGGTTSFIDFYYHQDQVAKATIEQGMRGILSVFFTDYIMRGFKEDLSEVLEICKTQNRLKTYIAPHAPYTCNDENIKEGISLANKYGLGINTHLAETQSETPDYIKTHGTSPTRFLNSIGLFSPKPVVAAHCVYLDSEEMDILASNNVSAAHNPKSNLKLGSGVADVTGLISHGVNVTIGTDGAASNNNLDMWEEMRFAALLQKGIRKEPEVLPAYTVLKMATVNGAQAMGMENELGIIKEGALADIIIINRNSPHSYPYHSNILSSLVYSGKSSDIDTTIVDGKILVKDGKLINVDIKTLGNECTKRINELS